LLKDHPAMVAAQMAVDLLRRRVQGLGGIILISPLGHYGFAHNTTNMAFAYVDSSDKVVARIHAGPV